MRPSTDTPLWPNSKKSVGSSSRPVWNPDWIDVFRWLGLIGLFVILLRADPTAAAAPQTADVELKACPLSSNAYQGRNVQTPREFSKRFMMISAFGLEPYSDDYLVNALADIGRHGIDGIVYGTLGEITSVLRKRGSPLNEAALNRKIFEIAKGAGAQIWLQIRAFDNQLSVGSKQPTRNVPAEEILTSSAARRAFDKALTQDVALYNRFFGDRCVVIMFEEAGIYHAPKGGGMFWSSDPHFHHRPNRTDDELFAHRFAKLFAEASRTVKAVNRSCSVGFHIGHSALNDEPVFRDAMSTMKSERAMPDFIFYDFYLKAQSNKMDYQKKLTDRVRFLSGFGVPVLHLAQLQTMNNFQHGYGATPSRQEIDWMMRLDQQLGLSGTGYYTKNAVPTTTHDNNPLAPNVVGQSTVYQSSQDRWDYGVLKLFETGGVDFRDYFDLVVDHPATSAQQVSARNIHTGDWDLIGELGAKDPARLAVFRGLDARLYLQDERRLSLRLTGTQSAKSDNKVWIVPSEPATSFRTTASVQAEIGRSVLSAEGRCK